MKKFPVVLILLLGTLDVAPMLAQSPKYPPLNEYLMARDVEIALAKWLGKWIGPEGLLDKKNCLIVRREQDEHSLVFSPPGQRTRASRSTRVLMFSSAPKS